MACCFDDLYNRKSRDNYSDPLPDEVFMTPAGSNQYELPDQYYPYHSPMPNDRPSVCTSNVYKNSNKQCIQTNNEMGKRLEGYEKMYSNTESQTNPRKYDLKKNINAETNYKLFINQGYRKSGKCGTGNELNVVHTRTDKGSGMNCCKKTASDYKITRNINFECDDARQHPERVSVESDLRIGRSTNWCITNENNDLSSLIPDVQINRNCNVMSERQYCTNNQFKPENKSVSQFNIVRADITQELPTPPTNDICMWKKEYLEEFKDPLKNWKLDRFN
jgi:hypothetical protein